MNKQLLSSHTFHRKWPSSTENLH